MKKLISTADYERGEVVLIRPEVFKTLKTAEEYSSEAQKFIYSLPRLEDKFYCLVIALGAGEYWGANRNGDYFPEEELKKSYHTFKDGHVFELHKNDDPSKSIGRVLEAFWNDKMKRVELVIEVDKVKGYKYYEKLERGETVDVSMGCKVEYDICSICGNKSKTRAEYCEHLKYHMNEVLPDGRKVYAINPNPVFFDISFVRRGADPTAKVLLKVAQAEEATEKTAVQKLSEIEKEVPALAVKKLTKRQARELIERANAHLEELPDLPIEEVIRKVEPHDLLYTLGVLGIPVKLKEFRMIMYRYPTELSPEAFRKLMETARFIPDLVLLLDPELLLKRSFYTQLQLGPKRLSYPADELYDGYQRAVILKLGEDEEPERRLEELSKRYRQQAVRLLAVLALIILAYKQLRDELRVLRSILGYSGVGIDPRWRRDLAGFWDATVAQDLATGVIPPSKNLLEQHGNLLGGIIALDKGLTGI